jgi:hypothetical protein
LSSFFSSHPREIYDLADQLLSSSQANFPEVGFGAWAGIAVDGSERPLCVEPRHSALDRKTLAFGAARHSNASKATDHPAEPI